MFQETIVTTLLKMRLDHHPILLKVLAQRGDNLIYPFCFEIGWATYKCLQDFVKAKWNSREGMASGLRNMANQLREWNIIMFGNIFKCKRMLMARLGRVQKEIKRKANPHFYELEA